VVVLDKRTFPKFKEAEEGRWLVLCGFLLLLVAAANTLWGVAALANEEYFAADDLLYGDLAMWASVLFAVALMQTITAMLLFSGNPAGVHFGLLAAGLNMLGQLMAVGAYPIWSVVIICLDVVIIYGLTVHGLQEEG
jgi:hypothetical protein